MGEIASGFGELIERVGVGDRGDARQFAGEIVPVPLAVRG